MNIQYEITKILNIQYKITKNTEYSIQDPKEHWIFNTSLQRTLNIQYEITKDTEYSIRDPKEYWIFNTSFQRTLNIQYEFSKNTEYSRKITKNIDTKWLLKVDCRNDTQEDLNIVVSSIDTQFPCQTTFCIWVISLQYDTITLNVCFKQLLVNSW